MKSSGEQLIDFEADTQRINPKSLERQAAELIRSNILNGIYPVGSRQTEIRLSNDIGLSRGTIRGALQQLVHEGLFVLSPYRGWSVVSLSAKDAWEIYTLRNVLEGLGSRILAENITSARASEIRKCFESLKGAVKSGVRERIIHADFEFHRTIINLSGHSRLQAQYKVIEKQALLFVAMAGAFVLIKDYVDLHEQILDAITAGKPQLAQKVASSHNTVDGEALVKNLQDQEALREKKPLRKVRRSKKT